MLTVLAADATIPAMARAMFEQMGGHIEALENRIAVLDCELASLRKAHLVSWLLGETPGVSQLIAVTMALTVGAANFVYGRHFAAWLRDGQWERLRELVLGGRVGERGPRCENRRFVDALLWMARLVGRWLNPMPRKRTGRRHAKRSLQSGWPDRGREIANPWAGQAASRCAECQAAGLTA